MNWFKSVQNPKIKAAKKSTETQDAAEGLWVKCPSCKELLQTSTLAAQAQVCNQCQYHFRLSVRERLDLLLDPDSFQAIALPLISTDPLQFQDKIPYGERLKKLEKKAPHPEDPWESISLGQGKILGLPCVLAVMDFHFMGGSMGVVCGEGIARCMELALELRVPCLVVSASGGARMQEGLLSLMQMAKCTVVRERLRRAAIPYISLLTDPTTGGVAASFALQGDIHLVEQGAMVGFAGPRVIEQSIRQSLPAGFQTADFLLEKGMVDRVVHRKDLRRELGFLLSHLGQHLQS